MVEKSSQADIDHISYEEFVFKFGKCWIGKRKKVQDKGLSQSGDNVLQPVILYYRLIKIFAHSSEADRFW